MDLSRSTSSVMLRKLNTIGKEGSPLLGASQYQDFHSFLDQSPYATKDKKKATQPEEPQQKSDKTFNKDLNTYLDYFDPKRKEHRKLTFHSEIQDKTTTLSPDLSPVKISEDGIIPQQSSVLDQIVKNERDAYYMRSNSKFGYLPHQQDENTSKILDSPDVDKNLKKVVEALQERIHKLEKENKKLRVEVFDLTSKNKKYQTQVSSFIHEQERYAKVRDEYEKRIQKLQDYCKNNEESNAALQKILGLQEEEYFERIVAKKESSSLSPSKRMTTLNVDSQKTVKRAASRMSSIKLTVNGESGNSMVLDRQNTGMIGNSTPSIIFKKQPTIRVTVTGESGNSIVLDRQTTQNTLAVNNTSSIVFKKLPTQDYQSFSAPKRPRTSASSTKSKGRTTSFFDFHDVLKKK